MSTSAVRVLFVSPHAKAGGSERYLETLTDELGDPWIAGIVALEDGPLVRRLRERGRRVAVMSTGSRALDMVKAATALRREVRRTRPRAIHANGVKAALVAAGAAVGLDVPIVWVKHDHSFDGTLATLAAFASRIIVGVSQSVVAALPTRVRGRVRVVPNAVARPPVRPDAGRAALRRLVEASHDAPVVGLVGRLHPVKGHADFIRAAPDVLAAFPETRLAFLGGPADPYPDQRAELERLAIEEGIADSIAWLGHRDPPFELMSGFDAAVMPSKTMRGRPSEGFPLAAAELLAVGVPVVAYRRGGIGETLGGCGVLVPPDDVPALGAALVEVLSDAALRERMRACGLARADQLDVTSLAARMRELYREAAA